MAAGRKYTVVWICAITTEYAAACQFLDETHDKPDWVGINDDGEYTLGSVGGHNVVVVAMTRGEYGLASATGSVKDALRSFPDVRFGLMVGVGGGAPSPRHDVRLGDVVVGVPPAGAGDEGEGVQGGVFQYDYGENVQGERFRHTGCVYQAPAILRAAVDVLRAEYDAGEEGKRTHRWLGEAVEEVLARRPRLRGRFGRPDASEDRLYKPETLHPLGDKAGCATLCGDDPATMVARSARAEGGEVEVHYGVIASSNTLMKNARERDRMAAERGVACFEMEAAAAAGHVPCLVVRGVCDYADSHKKKGWQGFAALAAAAYAREVLRRVPPREVEAERPAWEVLGER